MSRRGWTLLLALGVVWGMPYLLIKVAVAQVSPATVVFARTAVGALLLLPFALRGGGLRPLRGHWGAVVAFAVLEIVGPWLFLSNAERTLSSSTTGLLVATVPIAAVLTLAALGYAPVVVAGGWPAGLRADGAAALVALGVVCTALAFTLFFRLIGEVGAARATLVAYLNPLVAVALGALVLGEPVTWGLLAATALILVGSALAARRAARRATPDDEDIAPVDAALEAS